MIWRGNRKERLLAERLVIDERLVVGRKQQSPGLGLETNRPIVRIRHVAAPRVRVQVVNEVAAADDENAFRSERRQTNADLVVKRWRPRLIDTQLDDWNIGRRVDM